MYKAGDTLGGYKLLKECGTGSFGSVFLAENMTTPQSYALKILYKQGNHFERELAGLSAYQEKCRHANLMRIYHVGQDDECIFYTMDAADNLNGKDEYVPDTIGNRLRKRKRLNASELKPMLDELLNGLEILHGAGLLHRDIKPDNILWVDGHAVLGDIGLVTQGINASMAGTPGFISPEVWNGRRDFEQRDDLYALAMTLYCALSGCFPKDYPDLPLSLTLGGGRDLIRAYNAVLAPDSTIRTVANWRKFESESPNRKAVSTRFYWGLASLVIFLLTGVLVGIRYVIASKENSVLPIQPISRQPTVIKPRESVKPITRQERLPPPVASVESHQPATTLPGPPKIVMPPITQPPSPPSALQRVVAPPATQANVPPRHQPSVDPQSHIPMRETDLTQILIAEWESACRERIRSAQRTVVSVANLSQGADSRSSYTERQHEADGGAARRVGEEQEKIDTERKQISVLHQLAELLTRHFPDVLDDREPKLAAALLKQKEAVGKLKVRYDIDFVYGQYWLNGHCFGWPRNQPELEKNFQEVLSVVSPEEQRLLRHRAIYLVLRKNILSSPALMANPNAAQSLAEWDNKLPSLLNELDHPEKQVPVQVLSKNRAENPILEKRSALLKKYFSEVMDEKDPKLVKALEHEDAIFRKIFYILIANEKFGIEWVRFNLFDGPWSLAEQGWYRQYEGVLSDQPEDEKILIKRYAVFLAIKNHYLSARRLLLSGKDAEEQLSQWDARLKSMAKKLNGPLPSISAKSTVLVPHYN